jgi:hypothetical protein
MTLKLIPVERSSETSAFNNDVQPKSKRQSKNYAQKKNRNSNKSSKNICFRIVDFINRGSKFTCEQMDELILNMQRSIVNLQKKKREIIEEKHRKFRKN